MATTVTALTPAVGAIIENIDLRTLDESDFKTVAAAFDRVVVGSENPVKVGAVRDVVGRGAYPSLVPRGAAVEGAERSSSAASSVTLPTTAWLG